MVVTQGCQGVTLNTQFMSQVKIDEFGPIAHFWGYGPGGTKAATGTTRKTWLINSQADGSKWVALWHRQRDVASGCVFAWLLLNYL